VRGRVLDSATVNGLTLVRLSGEFDLSDGPLLRRALRSSTVAVLPDVALDMHDVDFMDCAVVGVLVSVSRSVTASGGCLRLVGLRPGPSRLLRVCGLDGVLCVHASTASATAAPCPVHRAANGSGTRIPAQQGSSTPTAV
jgi:anti-sigma B factor antagonist